MKCESNGRLELVEAAAPTLLEIANLAESAPPRIAAMLRYIREHLFDSQLSVQRIKDACGLRDNSIALHFHRVLGRPPGTFVTDQRIAVAERLLAGSWLPIWKITELLGYSSIQVFSRAYHRRKGRRPSTFRKQAPIEAALLHADPAAVPPLLRASDLMQRALAGELEEREAAHLLGRLLELYPPQRPSSAPASP